MAADEWAYAEAGAPEARAASCCIEQLLEHRCPGVIEYVSDDEAAMPIDMPPEDMPIGLCP